MLGDSNTPGTFGGRSVGLDVPLVGLQSLDPPLSVLNGLCPQVPDTVGHGDVESQLVLQGQNGLISWTVVETDRVRTKWTLWIVQQTS